MKPIKSLFLIFIFFSTEVFSQTPIIENAEICVTNNSTTNITVTNPSLTSIYIWQIKTTTEDWTDITVSNAGLVYEDYTSFSLNIIRRSPLPLSLTKYRVIANNGFGDLISNEAVLTVSPLSVAKTISGASAVCIGGNKQLTYASDSVGTIQWQSSTTSGTLDFEDIDLENSLTYSALDIQDNTWYRVANTSGSCESAFSSAVQVIVNSLPIAGYIDGADINVCKTLNATNMSLNDYEGKIVWQRATTIEGPYTPISSATLSTYRANSLITTTYFRVAVSSGVCPTEFSEPVFINVDPTPIAKTITGVSRVCTGSGIVLNYGDGSVGDIQWQSSTTSSNSDDFNDETEGTSSNFILDNLVDTTWFRVMHTSGECNPVFSPVFQIIVDPLPEDRSIDIDETTVCKTSNKTVLNLYNSTGMIQWQKATDLSGIPNTYTNITSAIGESFTASLLTETTYYRAVISSGVCAPFITNSSKIIVIQPNVAKTISGASPVCSGGSKVLVYEPGSSGYIQWQASTTSGTATDFSDIFSDVSEEDLETFTKFDLQETTWFRVTNTSEFCNPVNSPAVRVLVNPLPVSGTITIVEENNMVSKNISTPELSLINYKGSIQWQKSNSISGDFVDIPNATSSVFQTSGLKDSTYFRTVVSSGNCSKAVSVPINIKVNSDFDVTLFPNPFDNEFNINLTSLSLDPIEFEVYDLLGRTIDNQKIKPTEINSKKIGTNYLPGFYTLFIKQGKQNKSIKIIKK